MQCPFTLQEPTATSAVRRECASSSRAAVPPERQAAQWCARMCHANAGCRLEVAAGASHHGLATKERGVPPVHCPFAVPESNATSAARRARAARSCAAPPPERQPAQRRARAFHAKAGCVSEARAGTSYHGLAPMEAGISPVQRPFSSHGPTAISAVRRARASSSRAAPPLERQPAQRRVRTCHVKAGCGLEAAAGTSHHGLATKESDLPPLPFLSHCLGGSQQVQRDVRARQARVLRVLP